MDRCSFIKITDIFNYLVSDENSRNVIEGQRILIANHIIKCGIKNEDKGIVC
jgi:hypothetical protein